jgi:hypothetical protein
MNPNTLIQIISFRASQILCAVALLLVAAPLDAQVSKENAKLEIFPGDVWRDTNGQAINAHGGGILFHNGVYYWYGEVKEGRTYLPQVNKNWGGTRVVAGGVSCYSSTNLVEWKKEGIVLPSVADDPDHDLACENVIERPKVIYNLKTQKFVMWLHQDSRNYKAARAAVAVSDSPIGPFKYIGSVRPNAGIWPINVTDKDKVPGKNNTLERDFAGGQMARDMTLFRDDDGKAISLLTDDYLKHAGQYSRVFIGQATEAPAMFKRAGKYYILGSGCTGWLPNTARMATADNIWGPYTEQYNPCKGSNADKTYYSQSTHVFQVVGQPDQFIAMFDRWKQWDLADSRYVWLPLEFAADGTPTMQWKDRWSPQTGLSK